MTGLTREVAKECVGPGWARLIDRFYDAIEQTNDPAKGLANMVIGQEIHVVQIKEKFGGLRIHFIQPANEDLWSLLSEIESESLRTCEACGKPGKPTGRSWIKTACDDHKDPNTWPR